MFRPQRTTVLFAIVAEPVEKPDARLVALDCHSVPRPVSQSISPRSIRFPVLIALAISRRVLLAFREAN